MVIWKDVEGFEGLYKVSNEGVLVSTPRKGTKGGVVKPCNVHGGYLMYRLCKKGKIHRELAHRLLANHFIPNLENKPYINHIDGNPINNTLDNLEWVTQKENVQHAIKMGLVTNMGETHYQVKLTDGEVLEIRDLYKHKIYNQRELGEIYGVGQANVSSIILNRTRKAVGS